MSYGKYARLPLERLRNTGRHIDYPWTIMESKYLDEGYTDSIMQCTSCIIKGANEFHISHLKPCRPDLDSLTIRRLKEAAEKLREGAQEKLTGFICGGIDSCPVSRRNFNLIKAVFDKLGIDTTIIWGQKTKPNQAINLPKCAYYYDRSSDQIIFHPKQDQRTIARTNSIKGLKHFFEIVDIKKTDSIQFDY